MIRISFSDAEINALHYERFHHPHPRVQKKMEALYLKSQGLSHQDICRITRISDVTLVKYLTAYLEGGVEKLKAFNYFTKRVLTINREQMALHITTVQRDARARGVV